MKTVEQELQELKGYVAQLEQKNQKQGQEIERLNSDLNLSKRIIDYETSKTTIKKRELDENERRELEELKKQCSELKDQNELKDATIEHLGFQLQAAKKEAEQPKEKRPSRSGINKQEKTKPEISQSFTNRVKKGFQNLVKNPKTLESSRDLRK